MWAAILLLTSLAVAGSPARPETTQPEEATVETGLDGAWLLPGGWLQNRDSEHLVTILEVREDRFVLGGVQPTTGELRLSGAHLELWGHDGELVVDATWSLLDGKLTLTRRSTVDGAEPRPVEVGGPLPLPDRSAGSLEGRWSDGATTLDLTRAEGGRLDLVLDGQGFREPLAPVIGSGVCGLPAWFPPREVDGGPPGGLLQVPYSRDCCQGHGDPPGELVAWLSDPDTLVLVHLPAGHAWLLGGGRFVLNRQ